MPLSNLGVDFPSVVQNPSKEELFTRHLNLFGKPIGQLKSLRWISKKYQRQAKIWFLTHTLLRTTQYDQLLCCLGCVAVAQGAGKRASALLF